MSKRFINGNDFTQMVFSGAALLQANVNVVNSLNVFPVPDGDTGTNMNMTLTSGVNELKKRPSEQLSKAAEALSKGLLMGARGNSGVILSQLFRGFSKALVGLEQANPVQVAQAFQQGVDTAYQAVVKPVEGTILTVSREAARHAVLVCRRVSDVTELMREVLTKAKDALARTPDQLPVLKQVGVVDSGGQGLVYIYEGFLQALEGRQVEAAEQLDEVIAEVYPNLPLAAAPVEIPAEVPAFAAGARAQAQLETESIDFPYDMEFFIHLDPVKGAAFNEGWFRDQLGKDGDSIIVIPAEDIVKVHVHSKAPGDVLNLAMQYGELGSIHILNMRDQHRELLDQYQEEASYEPAPVAAQRYGMIAVSAGEGIRQIFESMGVGYVLSGGQTMNPSTEDILNAIQAIPARTVFVLPNNSNIILAAQQAKELAEKEVIVIPSKTISQGLAAVFAFDEMADAEANQQAMTNALSQVKSGQVTYAIRDTEFEDLSIKQGDYIGLLDNKIVTTSADLVSTCQTLLNKMLANGEEIVTILTGEEADPSITKELTDFLSDRYSDAEIEVHYGGQPLYYYMFSVE